MSREVSTGASGRSAHSGGGAAAKTPSWLPARLKRARHGSRARIAKALGTSILQRKERSHGYCKTQELLIYANEDEHARQ